MRESAPNARKIFAMTETGSDRRTMLAVGALCLALAAVGHLHGHRVYLDHLDTPHTLYPPASGLGHSPPSSPLARRLWVVIIDGLRDDVAARVPAIRELAVEGVRRTLIADFPSFTHPALASFETGAPGLYSGTRLNSGRVRLAYDSLDDEARVAGIDVLLADDGWQGFAGALEGPQHREDRVLTIDELLARPAVRELAWIHLERVDRAGHLAGAASKAYEEAARDEGLVLARLAAALDLSRDALFVVSDHGHLDRGGHGGAEPSALDGFLVARGPAIRRGVALAPARQRDVCATLALVAGLAPPSQSLGWPMVDLLALDMASLGPRLLPFWEERARAEGRFAAPLARFLSDPSIGRALAAGRPNAVEDARARLADAEREREGRREAELRRRALGRVPILVLVWTLLAAAFSAARRTRLITPKISDIVPLAVAVAVFILLFCAAGYGFTWSIPRGEAGFLVDTALFGSAAGLAGLIAVRPRTRARLLGSATLVFLVGALGYALSWWAVGGDPAWLGGPRVSFGLPLIATFDFYVAGIFGVALFVSVTRGRKRR